MKNITRIVFATVIASTLLVGCGNKKAVETEQLETLGEETNESEDTASREEAPQATTLEEYFNERPDELQDAIDKVGVTEGEINLDASGNTVIFKYIMPNELNQEQIDNLTKEIQSSLETEEGAQQMEEVKKEFSSYINSSGEDITIVFTYLDAAGNEVFSKTY